MNKKHLFLWSILILITSISYIFLNNNILSVSANPDYICTKTISWRPCNIESCWVWRKDGSRICTWTRTLEVSYYHTRTSCEAWYKVTITWKTHSLETTAARFADKNSLDSNYTSWSSWRHSTDYVSKSERCSVTQIDKNPPIWNISWF